LKLSSKPSIELSLNSSFESSSESFQEINPQLSLKPSLKQLTSEPSLEPSLEKFQAQVSESSFDSSLESSSESCQEQFSESSFEPQLQSLVEPSQELNCEWNKFDDEQMQTARHMVQTYISSQQNNTGEDSDISLGTMMRNVRKLFKDMLPPQVLEDILAEALELASNGDSKSVYADRFVQGILASITDPDCMTREFDLTDEGFDAEMATKVMKKCKLLVLRNVFDTQFLNNFKTNFAKYIYGLHSGRISDEGRTTNGEKFFLNDRGFKRWEVLLPLSFAQKELLANNAVMEVLSDNRILGPNLVLHSLGTVLAEPGANGQSWHKDDNYLFLDSLHGTSGIGGNDLPSYAVTMMVPMLNITYEHGPTEFCIGSSFLDGFDLEAAPFKNQSLRNELVYHLEMRDADACPMERWRSPQLNFGDMLLFDYQIEHRGGANLSPDMRSIICMTYSRAWYKDPNFTTNLVVDDINGNGDSDDDDYEYEFIYDKDNMSDEDDGYREGDDLAKEVQNDEDDSKGDDYDYSEYEDDDYDYFVALLHTARFAIPDRVPLSDIIGTKLETSRLEDIEWLFPEDALSTEDDTDAHGAENIFEFVLSNKNVDFDELTVFLDDRSHGNLAAGDFMDMEAKAGCKIEVRDSSGQEVKSWTVDPEQKQLIITKINTLREDISNHSQ